MNLPGACWLTLTRRSALLILLTVPNVAIVSAEDVAPLSQAHSHNDYLHERPLLDALEYGFCSVEADVFLVDGELLVGHSRTELRPSRTLEALYLAPLRERVAENRGRVYPDGPTFTLLVDIKSDAESTYVAIRKTLHQYGDIVTTIRNGQIEEKAVTVILSGNRAAEKIAADPIRLAAIDGRLADLGTTRASDLVPLISDRWTSHFTWHGDGSMPLAERQKLHDIVRQAHQAGRRVRFWATPDEPAVWRELIRAEIDLINTDDLAGLQMFLLNEQ